MSGIGKSGITCEPRAGGGEVSARVFEIDVDGFMPEQFTAENAAKARYAAFLKFCEAYRCSFRDFLGKSRIRELRGGGTC